MAFETRVHVYPCYDDTQNTEAHFNVQLFSLLVSTRTEKTILHLMAIGISVGKWLGLK